VKQSFLTALILFTALCFVTRVAQADNDDVPAPATTQPSNKSQYTLFNPTPAGQLREMETDRPDKTDDPLTIDAGHLQIETGVFDYDDYQDHYKNDNAREEALEFGDFDFRLGVLNNLELDAEVSSYNFVRTTDYITNQSTRQNGVGDLVVGGKLNFWGNDDSEDVWDTALGLEPEFKIPTARQDIGNGHPEIFIGVPFMVNLPAKFTLTAETTVSWERNSTDNGDVTGWQNALSLDRVFSKFDVYLEYWSHVSTQRHLEAQQTLDVGFTYPLADNVIVDTGVNFGLNRASDTIEWTAGVTVRF
jgi:hypothetical protein